MRARVCVFYDKNNNVLICFQTVNRVNIIILSRRLRFSITFTRVLADNRAKLVPIANRKRHLLPVRRRKCGPGFLCIYVFFFF